MFHVLEEMPPPKGPAYEPTGLAPKTLEKYSYIGSLIKAIRENIKYPTTQPRKDKGNAKLRSLKC